MVKIYADGADLNQIELLNKNNIISGFTTNPSLMRKAGVEDYKTFAQKALSIVGNKSISFEVFADDYNSIQDQARKIAKWGDNVFVKVPIMNTKGENNGELIKSLTDENIKLNVTAIFTIDQVDHLSRYLNPNVSSIISVFAGRIADTGVDPIKTMTESVSILSDNNSAKLLWASPREVINVYQANDIGCDIITVGNDIISKLNLKNKDLVEYSRETVQMFFDDAVASKFTI